MKQASVIVCLALIFSFTNLNFSYSGESINSDIICTIPVGGDRGVHYAGSSPGIIDWGPTAFVITDDGHFIISDAPENRLLEYNSDCSFLSVITIPKQISIVSDMRVTQDGFLVLDPVSETPAIYRLNRNGSIQKQMKLPREFNSLTSFEKLIKNKSFSIYTNKFLDIAYDTGLMNNIRIERSKNSSIINKGSASVDIRTEHPLTELSVLHSDITDNFFVYTMESVPNKDGTGHTDEIVRQYDSKGNFLGIARIPEQFIKGSLLTMTNSGDVVVMITYRDRVELHQLNFHKNIPRLSETFQDHSQAYGESTQDQAPLTSESVQNECKIFRDQMFSIAHGYLVPYSQKSVIKNKKNFTQPWKPLMAKNRSPDGASAESGAGVAMGPGAPGTTADYLGCGLVARVG